MKIKIITLSASLFLSCVASAQIGTGATVERKSNQGIGTGAVVNNQGIGHGARVSSNQGLGHGAQVNNQGIGHGAEVNNNPFHFGNGGHHGDFNNNKNNGKRNTAPNNNKGKKKQKPRQPKPRPGVWYGPEYNRPRPIDIESLQTSRNTADKATVFIDLYSYGYLNRNLYTWVTALHNKVVNTLIDTRRVNVIDVAGDRSFDVYDSDADRNGSLLRARRQRMRSNGGTYALEIQICDMACYSERDRRDIHRVRWCAECDYHMRLVDLATGEIIDSKDYDPRYDAAEMDDRSRAIDLMNGYIAERARYMTLNDFHVNGNILQIIGLGNNEAKQVAINIGDSEGVVRGTKFNVYQARYIGNQLIKDKIGKISVSEVKGSHVSYAKVKKGGDLIYQFYHMNQPGRLYIETGEPGLFD